jgi:hypothetical protein
MKKGILSILAVLYLSVTCGVVINFHYCMDRLASTSFFGTEKKKCGQCGMDIHQSNGCCRDEVLVIKMNNDQDSHAIAFENTVPATLQFTPSVFIVASFQHTEVQRHFHNHSPPLLSGQDIYLQHNVFRI